MGSQSEKEDLDAVELMLSRVNDTARVAPQTDIAIKVNAELTAFKSMRSDVLREGSGEKTRALTWWKNIGRLRFPCLAKVARVFLGATATEASCERQFSIAKRFLVNRPSLAMERLELLVFLKANQGRFPEFKQLTQELWDLWKGGGEIQLGFDVQD